MVTYGGTPTLKEKLVVHFGRELELPALKDCDITLLDEAMLRLNPMKAVVRVVEVDIFTVRAKLDSLSLLLLPFWRVPDTYNLVCCHNVVTQR